VTLELWKTHGWLQDHKTSQGELSNLLLLVNRDLQDSIKKEISLDWRFNIAYNAGLQLATAALYSAGYRTGRGGSKHYRVIQAIPLVLGEGYSVYRDFFENCRKKRNISEYDMAGTVSEKELKELLDVVEEFKTKVEKWLRNNNPDMSIG